MILNIFFKFNFYFTDEIGINFQEHSSDHCEKRGLTLALANMRNIQGGNKEVKAGFPSSQNYL